jgi:hypothetical protein
MNSKRQCPECGNEISATAKFCMHCGANLLEAQLQENPMKSGAWGEADNLDLTQEKSDYWEEKAGNQTMQAVGWFLKAVKNRHPQFACSVGKAYISIVPIGDTRRTDFILYPQKKAIVFAARVLEPDGLQIEFESIGASVMSFDEAAKRVRISVPLDRIEIAEALLIRLLDKVYGESDGVADPRDQLLGLAAKSAVRTIGSQLGREIVRNVLGSILAGKRGGVQAPEQRNAHPERPPATPLQSLIGSIHAWARSTGAENPEPDIDEAAGSASYAFSITVDDRDYSCYLDVHVEPMGYLIYVYSDLEIPAEKAEQVAAWCSDANEDQACVLEVAGKNRVLRCMVGIGLETPEFEPAAVEDTLKQVFGRLKEGVVAVQQYLQEASQNHEVPDAGSAQPSTSQDQISENSATKGEGKMRLTSVMTQWLKQEEWQDQPEVAEDQKSSSLGFGYGIGDFSLKCWFDANEPGEIFKLYMYYRDAKIPEKRMDEVKELLIGYAPRVYSGALHLLADDRQIRYLNAIDVEQASFEPAHISGLLRAGSNVMEDLLPRFMAVCFGGKTAQEALEDSDE